MKQSKEVFKSDIKRTYAYGLAIIFVIVVCIVLGFFAKYWLDRNEIKFQSPIVLRTPVWVEIVETAEVREVRVLQEKIRNLEASASAAPEEVQLTPKKVNAL